MGKNRSTSGPTEEPHTQYRDLRRLAQDYASVNRTDPFAYSRMSNLLRRGIEVPKKVAVEVDRARQGRHGRIGVIGVLLQALGYRVETPRPPRNHRRDRIRGRKVTQVFLDEAAAA